MNLVRLPGASAFAPKSKHGQALPPRTLVRNGLEPPLLAHDG